MSLQHSHCLTRGIITFALACTVISCPVQGGDVLRGGAGGNGSSKRSSEARSSAGAEAADVAKTNARDRLARTTQAITAVRNMQKGASSAIVPDGLVAGGLERATGINARWDGADAPSQSGNSVTIKQTDSQAVLHWKTFNVGRGTKLRFDQSAGKDDASKWVAFNKVFDPTGKPSQILGSISAEGQVYVLNQNGIIFGAGAQVNVRALVASSLPINDNLIERGLLNNPDAQYLFSALPIAAGSKGTPAFTPPAPLTADGRIGDVVVERGAFLSSPVSAEGYGGRIMLVAPNVRNEGVIATPAGQTILAAGLQVGIDAHSSDDPSLRGLDVYVGAISDPVRGAYDAEAKNTGLIEAARGSVIMAGRTVRQHGAIESSTSVDVNGRIDLLASYNAISNTAYDPVQPALGAPFLSRATGLVELGEDSVIRILPEWANAKTIARASLPLQSQVNMRGRNIHFGRGSAVLAPSAKVSLDAGEWIYQPSASNPRSTFVFSSGEIYLDEGSLVDVSGSTDIFVPLAHSIVTIQMRGSELANSPLQRAGTLRGVDLVLDLRRQGSFYGRDWVGTPLGDATGYLNLIERNVGQLTMEGGTVSMRAGGSVVVRKGAIVDASGGYARNEAGRVQTSRIRLGRHILDIADATPDRLYDGFYEGTGTKASSKWGISQTYSHPLAPLGAYSQNEYIAGANAGVISISAPSMALDGELTGRTVVGPQQLRETALSSTLPRTGRLELIFEGQDKNILNPLFPTISPNPPRIIFANGASQPEPGAFSIDALDIAAALPVARTGEVILSPEILGDKGFGQLLVRNSDGDILVSQGVALVAPAGGVIDLTGANVDIKGDIFAPGGAISLTAYNFSPYKAALLNASNGDTMPLPDPSRGTVRLASGSTISASGLVVDDRLTGLQDALTPIAIDGGTVEIEAYNIDLAGESHIDVSGGIVYGLNGGFDYGYAGGISLLSGQDPNLAGILGGRLNMAGLLTGYSGAGGGLLAIKASLIQIGGASPRPDTLVLEPSFFSQGGFSKFELTGIGAIANGVNLPAVLISPGTIIEPVVSSAVAVPYSPGGSRFASMLKPVGVRDPISLFFGGTGAIDSLADLILARGDIVMGEGSAIRTDPLGEVIFDGETVSIFGSISTPGGRIAILGADEFPLQTPGPVALPTVFLSSQARLSAAGTTLLLPDSYGRRRGYVLPGGLIEIGGNIVAESGAVIDVSGAAGTLDLTPSELSLTETPAVPRNSGINAALFALGTRPSQVESNAGSIVLEGADLMVSDATLLGRPGGPTALGGFLSISSGRYVADTEPSTTADINLIVRQRATFLGQSPQGIGQAVVAADGSTIKGMGYFSVDQFTRGGFASLELGGNVRFAEPVTIRADYALLIGDGGVIEAEAPVSLSAAYIRLGQDYVAPVLPTDQTFLFEQTDSAGITTEYHPAPMAGTGSIHISAPIIDVGNLVLNRISSASLIADQGDIRGYGALSMTGELLLRAGQIYPATASAFDIFVYDTPGAPGLIDVQSSGQRPLPLSAGGQLSLMASVINQGGTLRAPLGSIALGWDGVGTAPVNPVVGTALAAPVTSLLTLAPGSVTSVSAVDPVTGEGLIIPYGLSPDGLSWIDPSGVDVTLSGLPAKNISLAAQSLQMQAGSLVDVSGGGDLYAYRWIPGNGGTTDILASEGSFAVMPGYQFNYAPYASFNSSASLLQGNSGYVNSDLSVGDQVVLKGSNALPAGTYTLLPARYALLPGAVLVTVREGSVAGTINLPDQSSLVSGYRTNSLTSGRGRDAVAATFEVLPQQIVRERAEYADYFATDFLAAAASQRDQIPQRLPSDAGRIGFVAQTALALDGSVSANAAFGGRGSLIDIAANGNIWIVDRDATAPAGAIVLNATRLASFGAESLLVGGLRDVSGGTVDVRAQNLILDNRGSSFSSPEIILAARENLTLADNASVASSGPLTGAAADLRLTGDGALVRVSGDSSASMLRTGFNASPSVNLAIGSGASISGAGITLDSTYDTDLHPLASLSGEALYLNSGRISILLDNPGAALPAFGLSFTGQALQSLQAAGTLSLLSYTSLDLYGTGALSLGDTVALRAGEIRGFNQAGGTIVLSAEDVFIDNAQGASPVGGALPLDGVLRFEVDTFRLGSNVTAVGGFADLVINASGGIHGVGKGGLSTAGALHAFTPSLTAAAAADQSITAAGELVIDAAPGDSRFQSGLGASIALKGASVLLTSDVSLPSGSLTVASTAGDILIGGSVDLVGTSQTFFDVIRYTNGGQVSLEALGGDVRLLAGSVIDVSASPDGGSAGVLDVSVPQGDFVTLGVLRAAAGVGGTSGSFSLDTLALPNLDALNDLLAGGSFFKNRSFRARTGDVTLSGTARASRFSLAADQGSIFVSGLIDASGSVGGEIALVAREDVVLQSGATLTVRGAGFNSAGQGGRINLEAGASSGGVIGTGMVDLQAGSSMDLSVDSYVSGDTLTPGSSAFGGQFSGILHLRAPRIGGGAGTDVAVSELRSSIIGASSIMVEGYKVYNVTGDAGTITSALQSTIRTEGETFLGAAGSTTANYSAMENRLLASNAGLSSLLVLMPGVEIVNTAGDITLGTTTSTTTSDWNLSTYRFGAKSAAGALTFRASGDLVFYNALSDGFAPTLASSNTSWLWLAPLATYNPLLPVNTQSWSYRLTAGADLLAASSRAVRPLASLVDPDGSLTGSVLLGKNSGSAAVSGGANALTSTAIANRFQVIRTGSGSIDINAGRNVRLLNPFASIYTVGTQVADPTRVFAAGDFVTPILTRSPHPSQGSLGAVQQTYLAQYSMAGGDVNISAGNNIERMTATSAGVLLADSSRQLPSNWLYRRGFVNEDGDYGNVTIGSGFGALTDPAASTTWWVDFSNFFQGVGALGGGDITLVAGQDVVNVDAVIPTNARAPRGAADADSIVEHGGGSLTVQAGRNIDGGIYYVERGTGALIAGGKITTNATRSPSLGVITSLTSPTRFNSLTWLPTTLFLGKGSFDVTAQGDILLGPITNPFLLPAGLNNKFWYKSYFNTYASDSAVHITSLGGDVTLRNEVTLPNGTASLPILQVWMQQQQLLTTGSTSAAFYQPWLRLAETSVAPFSSVFSLLPPELSVTALSGDINLAGSFTLFPSATGQLELVSSGGINALQPTGRSDRIVSGQDVQVWSSATINVSDANPASIPSPENPFAYYGLAGSTVNANNATSIGFLSFLDSLFNESGSYTGSYGVVQTKQALHAAGILHASDPDPLRIYAASGSLSGLTLFSPKSAHILASQDLSDISFYLQNVRAEDVSIVAAGRDIVAYDANSTLRTASTISGNAPVLGEAPQAGDIQISGPGALEVIAGRNIDLGTGAANSDGTGVGITSIGNARNPYLPFEGASLYVAAGLGSGAGLASADLDVDAFLEEFLSSGLYESELGDDFTAASVSSLSPSARAQLAVRLLSLVLRDTGRASAETGSYDSGFQAIETLFGSAVQTGDIRTRTRDIRTKSGGDIYALAPSGSLIMAEDAVGQTAPTRIGNFAGTGALMLISDSESSLAPSGIVTEYGGGISIFTESDVSIGQARIFTLRGGDITIWSSSGDIAAGAAAKTVATAPPTRVLIDPQSATIETDLSGLATGGGIGVLSTVEGVPTGDVDLIAPFGTVDAGDAGIRASGNLNIAAVSVLNADNISTGGSSVGVPSAPAVAAPNISGLASAGAASGAASSAANQVADRSLPTSPSESDATSIITVEVLGYGGGEEDAG